MLITVFTLCLLLLSGCLSQSSIQVPDEAQYSNFATQKLLESHYHKHVIDQQEFGSITMDEYLQGARSLVSSASSSDVLTKLRSNGDILFFNKKTDEFAVLTKDNVIRTYFIPRDGIRYFNRQ